MPCPSMNPARDDLGSAPRLAANHARGLRNELARLAGGLGGGPSGALESGDAELDAAMELLRSRLEIGGVVEADPGDLGLTRPYAAVVGVDRLGAIRDMGAREADAIVDVFAQRIAATVPTARLRRVGRSTIEFVFRGSDPGEVRRLLEALHTALETRVALAGQVFDLPVAVGYAAGEAGEPSGERLIELAERALAGAQTAHHKLVIFDAAAQAAHTDRMAVLRDLRTALTTDAVFLCYQPKLDARSGEIVAAEALIRWRHPERGMVPPDLFIGLAEQTGEIRHITERVLERAIADQAVLRANGVPLPLHVNISGALFCDDRFAAWALERIASAADPVGFEITETAMISDPAQAIGHMRRFVAAGVQIAIDDYGAGLSSLAYLKQLPAHELKIDKTFISGLTSSNRDPLIVRSTIELAHALDMKVTAEGVDSPVSQSLLTVMGCDFLQGYEISRPLPLKDFIVLLKARSSSAIERARTAGPTRGAKLKSG